MESAYSLTSLDWNKFLLSAGESSHLLPYWLDGLYKNKAIWDQHLSPRTQNLLETSFDFTLPQISGTQESHDGTYKFQIKFADGLEVETVLIPFHKRYTICLSTQVGCGMNCSFCYTGTQGLKRNLTAGEIVGQYLVAYQWLRAKNSRALTPSIVFMGQGEPLHNDQNVKQSIEVLNDRKILGVGLRQMTLSTVGYLPSMSKLKDFSKINIALSLHSPFDDQRSLLIPINKKYPLNEVLKALDEIPLLNNQFISYEYLLIKDFNLSQRHAEELFVLLSHRKAIINLIPFNPFPGSHWQRPEPQEIEDFRSMLVSKKLRVMVRSTKGDDILAACGQLKINQLARDYVL